MKRAQQITQILEGFKLGSLGVSKKPRVTPPEESPIEASEPKPETIPSDTFYRVITPRVTGQIRNFTDSWVNAMRWTETRDENSPKYKMFMICKIVDTENKRYMLQVLGGVGLKVKLNGSPNFPLANDADFFCTHAFNASSDKKAGTFFDTIFQKIEQRSFGYSLSLGKLGDWKHVMNIRDIEPYLKATAGMSSSKYLS